MTSPRAAQCRTSSRNKVDVNGITVRGRDQVMLKVTVAEVQRDVIKQLGIDLNGSVGIGHRVVISTPPIRSPPPASALEHRHHRQCSDTAGRSVDATCAPWSAPA